MQPKLFEIEQGEHIPYINNVFTLRYSITKEMIDDSNNPFYPPMPKSSHSKRQARRMPPIQTKPASLPSSNTQEAVGNVNTPSLLSSSVRHPYQYPITKQLLRAIEELHYSDGSVEKRDRTYTPSTTVTVY